MKRIDDSVEQARKEGADSEQLKDVKLKNILEEAPEFKIRYREYFNQTKGEKETLIDHKAKYEQVTEDIRKHGQLRQGEDIVDAPEKYKNLYDYPIWEGNLHNMDHTLVSELRYIDQKIEDLNEQIGKDQFERRWGKPIKNYREEKKI